MSSATSDTSKTLDQLRRRVIDCHACPRLVEWREQVSIDKRASYRDEEYWGRPADVQVLKDGSMLISDGEAGAIYRVSYAK